MLITRNSQAADIVLQYPHTALVFERLGIPLGFHEQTLSQLASQYALSFPVLQALLTLSMQIHSVNFDELTAQDIPILINYLLASHSYYTEEALPYIQTTLHSLLQYTRDDETTQNLLKQFLQNYIQEVETHFQYETHTAFPYMHQLLQGEVPSFEQITYSVNDYQQQHTNIDETLQDLQCLLVKYLQFQEGVSLQRSLYLAIHTLGTDIAVHTQIENELLIPLVQQQEQSLHRINQSKK